MCAHVHACVQVFVCACHVSSSHSALVLEPESLTVLDLSSAGRVALVILLFLSSSAGMIGAHCRVQPMLGVD